MATDAQSSVRHLELLLAMAQRLAALDIAIYEHNYYALVFGSWILVVGKRKERVRFSWDGRDGFLTVEQATVPDSRQQPKWEPVKTDGIQVTEYAETLDAVEKFLREKFAA